MKEAIEFIKHAVLNRKFDEQLTQIHACGNYIQSYNGIVRMSHPLPDIGEFSVVSTQLLNAIKACNYEPKITLTGKNLIIKRGNFRAQLPYSTDYLPEDAPAGKFQKIKGNMMEEINMLYPFISDDASRGWSQSLMIKKGFMYATNNIIVARVQTKLKNCILPVQLLSVMVRVKKEPTKLLVHSGAITVIYDDDTWICSAVSNEPWPAVDVVFDSLKFKKIRKIPSAFREGIETSAAFCDDDTVVVKDNNIVTNTSTVKEVDSPDCAFSCSNMKKILTTFTHADFSVYPEPMPIKGDGIEGAFVGRLA